MGIKVVCLSLIDVRSTRKAIRPKVGAVLGSSDWWHVDKFYTRELDGRVERTKMDIVSFQDCGSDVSDGSVIFIMKDGGSVRRGGM